MSEPTSALEFVQEKAIMIDWYRRQIALAENNEDDDEDEVDYKTKIIIFISK